MVEGSNYCKKLTFEAQEKFLGYFWPLILENVHKTSVSGQKPENLKKKRKFSKNRILTGSDSSAQNESKSPSLTVLRVMAPI